jgi:tetratricopeptide (TPR) repeat protein
VDAEAHVQRGIVARAAGNAPLALKAFEAAIALDPARPLVLFYAGDMHLAEKRYKDALRLANSGLAMPCSHGTRSFGLQVRIFALLGLGKLRQAEKTARDAIENEPDNAANHRAHARALWRLSRSRAAKKAIARALALAPNNVQTLILQASIMKLEHRLKEAMEVVDRAAVIAPDRVDLMILRGQIAFGLGRAEVARDMALWALSREATNEEAQELLAMLKARDNWFMAPYWRFFAGGGRIARFIPLVIGVLLGSLMSTVLSSRAQYDGVFKFLVLGGGGLYMAICVGYVAVLKHRDRRKVRLKADF